MRDSERRKSDADKLQYLKKVKPRRKKTTKSYFGIGSFVKGRRRRVEKKTGGRRTLTSKLKRGLSAGGGNW